MNWRAFLDIDWEQFHFLRPEWLWLLIPIILGFILLWIGNVDKNKWKGKISPHLQSYMFSKGNPRALAYILGLYLITALIMLVAASRACLETKRDPGGG